MTVHRTADIFSRRTALALAGGGAGALLLAACGSGDGASNAANSASSTGSASEGSGGAGSTAAAGSSPSAASASTETNPGSLRVIVNKMRPFSPKEWEPEDLVDFEGHQLRAEAAEAAKKMMRAAKQEGVELTVSSAYRSYAVQQQTYQHWVEVNGKQKADTLSARSRVLLATFLSRGTTGIWALSLLRSTQLRERALWRSSLARGLPRIMRSLRAVTDRR